MPSKHTTTELPKDRLAWVLAAIPFGAFALLATVIYLSSQGVTR